jgi:hypothetical protein
MQSVLTVLCWTSQTYPRYGGWGRVNLAIIPGLLWLVSTARVGMIWQICLNQSIDVYWELN